MAVDWLGLALIHTVLGYEANVIGLLVSNTSLEDVHGLFITGFLLYTISAVLTVLVKAGGVGRNVIVTIISLCCLVVAGVLIIAGVGVWGDQKGNSLDAYNGTLDCSAALMAFLAALFLLLSVLCGGGGGGSKTTPNA